MSSPDILKRIKQILRIIYSREEAGDPVSGCESLGGFPDHFCEVFLAM
jgi:hypothetical protein